MGVRSTERRPRALQEKRGGDNYDPQHNHKEYREIGIETTKNRKEGVMAGTRAGAKKMVATITELYGADYFRRIGHKGGSVVWTKPRGFAAMTKERLREIALKGNAQSIKVRSKK